MNGSRVGLCCVIVALLGCAKFKSLLGKNEGDAAASASAQAATTPEGERAPGDEGPCTPGDRKVWGKWANRRTGITPVRIGDKLVLGVALGNTPHVLVVDKDGGGRIQAVRAPEGSALAKDLRAPDQRDLHRVTPIKRSDGTLSAYADYRDKYRDGRRRIACGAVESTQQALVFDGKPLIDPDEKKADKKKPEDKPDAGAQTVATPGVKFPRFKLPSKVAAAPAAAADAAAPAPAATPPPAPATPPAATAQQPPPADKKKAKTELRDCRSFADDDGTIWAVGTELRGEPQDDGSHKWSMRFFAAPDAGRGYVLLHTVALPKEPKQLSTFETAVGAPIGAAGHALFARYQGSLFGWGLGAGFRASGGLRVYRGGYPTMPHLIPDASGLLALTSIKVNDQAYELRGSRLTGTRLPAALDKIEISGADASLSEPTFARAGRQSWLSYQAGARREGRLVVVPVDDGLKPVGKSYNVTPQGSTVYESHIFGLGEGKLLAVYIQNAEPGAELVSQVLSCSVKN